MTLNRDREITRLQTKRGDRYTWIPIRNPVRVSDPFETGKVRIHPEVRMKFKILTNRSQDGINSHHSFLNGMRREKPRTEAVHHIINNYKKSISTNESAKIETFTRRKNTLRKHRIKAKKHSSFRERCAFLLL
jgi:hypothetical protein